MNVQTTLTNIPIAEAVPNPDAHYSVTCLDGAQRVLETHEVSAAVRSLAGATAWRTGLAEWTSNLEDLLGVYLRSGSDASAWVSITEAGRVREGGCWVWVPTWVEWRELVVAEPVPECLPAPEPVRVVPLAVEPVKAADVEDECARIIRALREGPDSECERAVDWVGRNPFYEGLLERFIALGGAAALAEIDAVLGADQKIRCRVLVKAYKVFVLPEWKDAMKVDLKMGRGTCGALARGAGSVDLEIAHWAWYYLRVQLCGGEWPYSSAQRLVNHGKNTPGRSGGCCDLSEWGPVDRDIARLLEEVSIFNLLLSSAREGKGWSGNVLAVVGSIAVASAGSLHRVSQERLLIQFCKLSPGALLWETQPIKKGMFGGVFDSEWAEVSNQLAESAISDLWEARSVNHSSPMDWGRPCLALIEGQAFRTDDRVEVLQELLLWWTDVFETRLPAGSKSKDKDSDGFDRPAWSGAVKRQFGHLGEWLAGPGKELLGPCETQLAGLRACFAKRGRDDAFQYDLDIFLKNTSKAFRR